MALQPDGKAVIVGDFSTVGGQAREGLARLNADGTLDTVFGAGLAGANNEVRTVAVQEDGRIVIGGYFTQVHGASRQYLARLEANGTLDDSFAPLLNGLVFDLTLQSDGKILVAGSFSSVDGITRMRLARLLPDGALDTSFSANLNSTATAVTVQPDQKILVGGTFSQINGVNRPSVARLLPDGTLENSSAFNPGTGSVGFSGVSSVTVQTDGKIIVGGSFYEFSGSTRLRMVRLQPNGVLDTSSTFGSPGPNAGLYSPFIGMIMQQADGMVLASGGFDFISGFDHPLGYRLARFSRDGIPDSQFAPVSLADGHVSGMALQTDGKLLLSGSFTAINTAPRQKVARLHMESATGTLQTSPSADIMWLRGGTAPEILYALFSVSIDGGASWTHVGDGNRIAGGWQLLNPSLPIDGILRARGRTEGGGLVEVKTPYHLSRSEITVRSDGGAEITDGDYAPVQDDGTDFGVTGVAGGTVVKTFTIMNSGADPLQLTGTAARVEILGRDAADFTVTTLPDTPVAALTGSTVFRVTFDPSAPGVRQAMLTILNDDISESVYDFAIIGTGGQPALAPVVLPGTTQIYDTASTLTISGSGFSSTLADNAVTFNNGTTGTLTACTESSLTIGSLTNLKPGSLTSVVSVAGVNSGPPVTVATVLAAPGSLDGDFLLSASGVVRALAVQADGRIIVGGTLAAASGMPQTNIARLHGNGSSDTSFTASCTGGNLPAVFAAVAQDDGKIVVAGQFTTVNGTSRPNLARLNADGTLDESFGTSAGADGRVSFLMPLPDGKLLVLGGPRIHGVATNGFCRLLNDGTVDSTFNSSGGGPAALQPDGKIVVSGGSGLLMRLLPDGTPEDPATFHPAILNAGGVSCVVVQPDGRIVACASGFGGGGRIVRLLSDGTADPSFHVAVVPSGTLSVVSLQTDGSILVGGSFSTLDGLNVNNLGRLSPDGHIDPTYSRGLVNYLYGFAPLIDGAVLAAGGGGPRRLINYGAIDTILPSAGAVLWKRGGAAMEILRANFDLSTDGGATWNPLGSAERTADGWHRKGLVLPPAGEIRARGHTAGGQSNGSAGFIEKITAFGGVHGILEVTDSGGPPLANGAEVSVGSTLRGVPAAPRAFTLKNAGNASLLIESVATSGTLPVEFRISPSLPVPVRLTPGQQVSFSVTMTPLAIGTRIDMLTIRSSDTVAPVFSVNLTGTGLASNNPNLGSLTLGTGTLVPPFDPQTTDYLLDLSSSVTSVTVRANRAFATGVGSSLKLNGEPAEFGTFLPVSLTPGENLIILSVTAEDGITVKEYRILANRKAAGRHDSRWPLQGVDPQDALVLPDGRLLFFGTFEIEGTTRRMIRVSSTGDIDPSFPAGPGGSVASAACLPDGKILIAGSFQFVNGTARPNLARLLPDGTLDNSFTPVFDSGIRTLAIHPDGKITAAGSFFTVNGSSRPALARLNADGTLDSGFAPASIPSVEAICLQPDGKLLIGGNFTNVGGAARNRLARLDAGGAPDSFNPNFDNTVQTIVVQPDGKVLAGGRFSTIGNPAVSYVTSNHLVRLTSSGTVDTSAGNRLNSSNGVSGIQLQCDGRITVVGAFTRLTSSFQSDVGFDPDVTVNLVESITGLADGRTFLSGGFYSPIDSKSLNYVVLENDPAPQSLTVTGSSPSIKATWSRGGSAPEVRNVTFELSTDGGLLWTPLGNAVRVSGGWESPSLSLPASGNIRARGRTFGGNANGFTGLVETIASFGTTEPQLVIEHPAGSPLVANGTPLDFGEARTSTVGSSRTFLVRNTGTTALQLRQIASTGGDASDFIVNSLSTVSVLSPGGQTELTVTFAPSATGPRSATLHFLTSDPLRPFFRIPLTGTCLPSDNSFLESLDLYSASYQPEFNPAVTDYTASVHFPATSVTVSPTASHAGATIRINGTLLISGQTSAPILLQPGSNAITVSVLAEDEISSRNYTLLVNRSAPSIGDLEQTLGAVFGNEVMAIALEPSGRILLGGQFSSLLRRNPDGTSAQSPGYASSTVPSIYCVSIQPDGKILVGGEFNRWTPPGSTRNNILQLDSGFGLTAFNPGTDSTVRSIVPLADGKVLIAGGFTTVAGVSRRGIAKLNSDGTLDTAFDAGSNGNIRSLTVQPDGKILVGGEFTSIGSSNRSYFARLQPDGSVDLPFNPRTNGVVRTCLIQPDGKILAGGDFSSIAGTSHPPLARFHPDGTRDESFAPNIGPLHTPSIYTLALQTDGRIIAGGRFYGPGSAPRHLAMFLSDGSSAPGFDPEAHDTVLGTALQADGRIIIGGNFYAVGGAVSPGTARLRNEPATQRLRIVNGTAIEWLRSGSSPEVMAVSFDLSTDGGTAWTPLGSGIRMAGGWQLENLTLPVTGHIRARASFTSGVYNGSSSIIESVTPFPLNPLETWRLQHFGSHVNSGNGADAADFDHDGIPNLIEFALGLDPLDDSSALIPQWQVRSGEVEFNSPVPDGTGSVILTGEWTSDLSTGDWTSIANTGTAATYRFVLPAAGKTRIFLRLRVRTP